MEMQLQTKDTLATLHLDPRTKLYLLIVGNVALFLVPSLLYEIALVVCVVILGVLVGAKRFTVRMAAIYVRSEAPGSFRSGKSHSRSLPVRCQESALSPDDPYSLWCL